MLYTLKNLNLKILFILLLSNCLHGTNLHETIIKNNLENIESLLLSENINKKDNLGQSALHIAVWTNNHKAILLLLKYGADINLQDSFGRTPLHCAIYNQNLNLAKELIIHKAKIDIQDNTNRTAKELIYNRQKYISLLNNLKNQLNSKL